MKQKKQSDIATLLDYAGSHRRLTFLGLGLSAVSMVCSMVPYLCVWRCPWCAVWFPTFASGWRPGT